MNKKPLRVVTKNGLTVIGVGMINGFVYQDLGTHKVVIKAQGNDYTFVKAKMDDTAFDNLMNDLMSISRQPKLK